MGGDVLTRPPAELIDTYLNGPRTLSNERLSYLIVSEPGPGEGSGLTPPPTPQLDGAEFPPALDAPRDYELFICAAHFIGDGEPPLPRALRASFAG